MATSTWSCGFRVLVSSVDDQVGTGMPAIGMNWFSWDEETDLLFTAGGGDVAVVVAVVVEGGGKRTGMGAWSDRR